MVSFHKGALQTKGRLRKSESCVKAHFRKELIHLFFRQKVTRCGIARFQDKVFGGFSSFILPLDMLTVIADVVSSGVHFGGMMIVSGALLGAYSWLGGMESG